MEVRRKAVRLFENCRFGRWYLAEEECGNVAGSRSVERRVCGEAGREALARA